MHHTVALGDLSPHYHERGPCSLFWISSTYTVLLPCTHESTKYVFKTENIPPKNTFFTPDWLKFAKKKKLSVLFFPAKLSVAVCIGFFAAWSPYAVVSMWAAFGHIENIPPMAFAMPAMFAKSSTIYNPIIYLMLRPNFRTVMRRDLGTFCHACLKGCLCSEGPAKCCFKPEIRVTLRTIHRQTNQSSNSSAQPPMVELKDHSCEKCKDAFECFRHYPQICGVTNPAAIVDSSKDQDPPVPQKHKQKTQSVCHKSLLATICAKRTSEIENFHIDLEMVPGPVKVAWPWYYSQFIMFTEYLWTYFTDYVLSDVKLLNQYFQENLSRNVP